MQRGVALEVRCIHVSAFANQERDKVNGIVSTEIEQSHGQESSSLLILPVDIDLVELQEVLDDALVVFEHCDCDRRHSPRVFRVNFSSVLQ